MSGKALIVGCGNPSRSDDGVALYIVNELNRDFGKPRIAGDEYFTGPASVTGGGAKVDTIFVHQLGPELADVVKDYTFVVFVDAHTGVHEEDIRVESIYPSYVSSAFSHHLEPAAILALAGMLYGQTPEAVAVSVRGYDFQFGTELSERTRDLAFEAARIIRRVLDTRVLDTLPAGSIL